MKTIKQKLRFIKVGECHEFVGTINNRGYGRFNLKGKVYLAHRASYEEYVGDIPENLMICHKCNNRRCINPLHLYAGTMGENARDRSKYISDKKISNKVYSETACINVRVSPDIHRKLLLKCHDEKVSIKDFVTNLVAKAIE